MTPYQLTVCGIPELSTHSALPITHVLSLIDVDEPTPSAIGAWRGVDHELLRFDDVVDDYPGFTAVSRDQVGRVLAFGERLRDAGPKCGHLIVHCHAGISRSTAAAAVLMAQFNPGREEEAFLRLLDMRPHGWPNTRVVSYADDLLGRKGAMLKGLESYRRALLAKKPHLAQVVRNIGRGHELP